MTTIGGSNAARDTTEDAGVTTTASTRSSPAARLLAAVETTSGDSGASSLASEEVSSSRPEPSMLKTSGEKCSSSCITPSVERQRMGTSDACNTSAMVNVAGSEIATSAFASPELGYNVCKASAVVSCLSTVSPGAAGNTAPGHRVAAAAAAHVPANACPAAAGGASSSAASAGDGVTGAQLQSLSAFSRSVGISEFALFDSLSTCAAVEKEAASEGKGATAGVGRAAEAARAVETAKLPALKGSLKTLFEDFQVYEHSYFPCVCRDEQRSCRVCGSSDDSSDTATCCSGKADSSRSLNDGKLRGAFRRSATGDTDVLEPCAYGCWCKAFGGDKPLRLPYLVLASDVLREKQQQLTLESGAAHISTSFRLKPCKTFPPPHVSDRVESSSGISSVSTEVLVNGRETTSTIGASSPGACLRSSSSGSSGSSSSSVVGDVGVVSKRAIQLEKRLVGEFCRKWECLCASQETKGPGCCCPTAVAAPTAEKTPAAAGLTAKVVEGSYYEGCPFSPLEIQNVEAFVRFLAMSSALYSHRSGVTKRGLQATAQQEPGAVLHEQQDQQKRESIRHRGIQQQRGHPAQPQDSSRASILRRRDTPNERDARELEMESTSKTATHVSLEEESKISGSHASLEGGWSGCWHSTSTADSVAKERWEAAAARVAAEAEEAAVAAAAAFVVRNRESSSVAQEARHSERLRTATSENPFFEPEELHEAAEPAADKLSQQVKKEREEPAVEQQRRQQPKTRDGRKTKGERQSTREVSLVPVTQHLQERPRRGSEHQVDQQKRRQKGQDEKGSLPPVLWVLGDWVFFICRHMIEGEGARDADANVSAKAAGRENFNPPSVECLEAASGCAAAPTSSVFSASGSPVAAPTFAPVALAGERAGVSDNFAAAVAACVDRSAPSLKGLLKTVRTSIHDFARQNLPFVYADTLPLSLFLRSQPQHGEPHSKNHQQEGVQQQNQGRGSEQHEERQTMREEREIDVSDVHEKEQSFQRKQLQGEDVCMEEMKQRRWGLLRMYTPPGALQCISVQPFATTAATARRAAATARRAATTVRRAATTVVQGEVRGTLMDRGAAGGKHAEASGGIDRLTVEHLRVSEHALASETGEKEQEQFTKYFVSLAACVALQCQALQQLLTLLEHQQQQVQICLRQAEQSQVQQDSPAEEQMKGPQHWHKRQRFLVQLARCEEWIHLVTAALAALTDEKEQPQLMLVRLTPMPACLRYLFPRRNKELPEEPEQLSLCVDFHSCSERMSPDATSAPVDDASAAGLGTRNSSLCCWSPNRGNQPGDAVEGLPGWRLPSYLRQDVPTAPFLHFVLLKVNRETAGAMRMLEQQLRHQRLTSSSSSSWVGDDGQRRRGRSAVNTMSVTVAAAGTKDKRGVTVQRCSVSKVSANALLEACYLGQQQRQRFQPTQPEQHFQQLQQQFQQVQQSRLVELQQPGTEVVHEKMYRSSYPPKGEQLPTMFVAPLGYYSEPQWLGGLRGNFFQVIVRNLRPASDMRRSCETAAPASACEEARQPQTSPAEEMTNACVIEGSIAGGAAILRTQTEQVLTGGGARGVESQGKSAEGRPAAAMAVAVEEARAGHDATGQRSLPSRFIRAPAQAAENSQYLRSVEWLSPHVGAEEQKCSEAPPREASVSSSRLLVPLSECEKNVQQLGEAVSSSMRSFRSLGFLNYYGLQRFGTHTVRTYEVGAAVLRGDWTAAVAGILGGKLPAHLGETAKDAAARHFEAPPPSEGAATLSSTEFTTVCEAATAGVADKVQTATTQRLVFGSGKQHGARHVILKSPWELLLEEGPAAALNSLAKHQHIERVVLSALLQHSRMQQTTDGQRLALKRIRRSAFSSSVDNSRLSCVSASSSSCPSSLSESNTLCNLSAVAFSDVTSSPHESTLAPQTVSASSSLVSSSARCLTPQPLQQKSSGMPVDRDFATPQKEVESSSMRKTTTEVHSREHPTVKHEQRQQSGALEQQRREQGNCCASSLQVTSVLSDIQAAPTAQLERSLPALDGYVRLPRDSSASADDMSAPTADTVVATAETITIEALARSARRASITQAPRCPGAVQFHAQFSVSPAMCFRALLEVAPASLQLYLHAAQSILFNFACSWRWRTYGPRVRVGDFVYNRKNCRSRTAQVSPGALSLVDGRFVDSWEATVRAGSCGKHKASDTDEDSCVQAADVGNLDAGWSSFSHGDKEIQSQGKAVESTADDAEIRPHFHQRLLHDFSAASTDRCDSRRSEDVPHASGSYDGENEANRVGRQGEAVEAYRHGESICKITTEEEARSASIHDVVLPLAGTDVEYPTDLLTVYQRLSREILGVEFEAFKRFNARATTRTCFGRQFIRQMGHDKGMRSNTTRETNYTVDKKGNSCDSCSSTNSSDSITNIHKRSNDFSNKRCRDVKERRLGKRKNKDESQQGNADLQTSEDFCKTDMDAESERLCTGLLSSSVTACAQAVAGKNMDLTNLGISCKGGFRPLLVRPRHCSWQLLRVGDDPYADPKPLLLSDVDLLLRGRHRVGRAEKFNDRMFICNKPVQQQKDEVAEDDFRVGFDDELSPHAVRCIPGDEERIEQVVNGVRISKCGSAAEALAESAGPQCESENVYVVGTIARASSSADDSRRLDENSATEEIRGHAYQHQEDVRTQRTNLVVNDERSNFCLLLRFWLPAGCYFTMALREIMRANAPDEDGAAFVGARRRNATAE